MLYGSDLVDGWIHYTTTAAMMIARVMDGFKRQSCLNAPTCQLEPRPPPRPPPSSMTCLLTIPVNSPINCLQLAK